MSSQSQTVLRDKPNSVCICMLGSYYIKYFLQYMDATGGTWATIVGQMDFDAVDSFIEQHREQFCGTLIRSDSNNDNDNDNEAVHHCCFHLIKGLFR